jgi:hypothetical protein
MLEFLGLGCSDGKRSAAFYNRDIRTEGRYSGVDVLPDLAEGRNL